MARPRRIDPVVVQRAQMTAAVTTSVESLRRCQAVAAAGPVWGHPRTNRRRSGGGPCDRAAPSGGLSAAAGGGGQSGSQLGRSPEVPPHFKRKKSRFLKPWLESAATGHLVVVSPIRAALAQRLANPSTLGGLPPVGTSRLAKSGP